MEKDLSSMLSTDPEDLNRLASVHSVSSCEEKPSYPFPWFLDLCDGSIGLMIPFYLFPAHVPIRMGTLFAIPEISLAGELTAFIELPS